MAAEAADIVGIDNLGIGSDLCQDQPDEVVRWMREGRWTLPDREAIAFPAQPEWFRDNRDFPAWPKACATLGFPRTTSARFSAETGTASWEKLSRRSEHGRRQAGDGWL